jgi:hypothetical protein
LELVGAKNNVKVNLNYAVSVDGDTPTLVTVKAPAPALVPLRIYIALKSEGIEWRNTEETVWDRLEAGQTLAEILSMSLDGLQLNIERENVRTISVPFGIKVRNHESLRIQLLDIDSLRTKWKLIEACTRGLTPEELKRAREKWMEY